MSKFKNEADDSPDDSASRGDEPLDADDAAEERARKRHGMPPLRTRFRLPMVSGKTSALALMLCFVMTAIIVVPLAWKMPAWIEAEIVLVTWWGVWVVALALLLHRGWHISDDHEWSAPRNWFSWGNKSSSGQSSGSTGDGCLSALDIPTFDIGLGSAEGCGEACAVMILAVVAVVVLFFAAWFVIEVAIPAGALVAYLLIRGMLARVANDKHGCENSWPRAATWGAFWATVYIIPQALVVWLIHILAAQAKAG
ncbi:hypothetical protein AYO44_18695 [Planctomycetaceae bacterium SCGC AG-212-F19]|nr:hypothetical protein AYO44_18695 [Planctomycetaceae bacterium SCGC AG-212-F19]